MRFINPFISAIRNVFGTMIQTELTTSDEGFTDPIAELANMVVGNARKDFAGLSVAIPLPSVGNGTGQVVSQSPNALPQLGFPCRSPFDPFEVEVAMVVEKASAQARAEAVGAAS